ncbi:MAG: SgcJ/EcaC family oxidoreductase [Flavobacteriales bacterium]
MLKTWTILFLMLAGTKGAGQGFGPAERDAIALVMSLQEKAWDAGDLQGFMDGYWDEVCFLGKADQNCGRDAVTARYKKSYPDAAAMGDLTFTTIEVLPAGEGHAWCTGTWKLIRTADTLAGRFSLLWQQREGEWRILRDHSD